MVGDCEELNPSLRERKREEDPILRELRRQLELMNRVNRSQERALKRVREENSRKVKVALFIGALFGFELGLIIGLLLRG